jgi:hypothetical protein
VSWLLVAFIPGLLMLATFGLERLETGLERGTVTAADVAEFLQQANSADVRTLARDGMPEALDCLHRRRVERGDDVNGRRGYGTPNGYTGETHFGASGDEPGLPTRIYRPSRPNPQFQPTQHANRV